MDGWLSDNFRETGPMTVGDAPDQDGGELKAFLARIRAGDESAARELLTRYEAQVRLVVRRQLPRLLRSRFDSLDFLQSVWGSFFRRMRSGPDEFEDPRYLVAFLARAARNKVIDQYRKACSRKQDMQREESLWAEGTQARELADGRESPAEVAEANEALDRLAEMLPADRRVILAWKAEGLSSKEIADRLGISERTVRRIIEDLRRRAGIDPGPASDADSGSDPDSDSDSEGDSP